MKDEWWLGKEVRCKKCGQSFRLTANNRPWLVESGTAVIVRCPTPDCKQRYKVTKTEELELKY